MAGLATRQRDLNSSTLAFLNAVLERSAQLDTESPPLARWRSAGRERLRTTGLPDGKLETFKYTPITRFYRDDLCAPAPDTLDGMTVTLGDQPVVPDSASLPDGVRVMRLSAGDSVAASHFDKYIDRDRHPLARVNTGLLADGLLVHVAAGVRLRDALHVHYAADSEGAPVSRLLVVVDATASLTLIETDRDPRVVNRVAELVLGARSSVTHLTVQSRASVPAWSLCAVDVGADATYRRRLYAAGATPRRNDLHVKLTGESADVDLKGAFVATGAATLDNQIVVEHIAPRGVSRHRFHGVAGTRGELTFNGRIHIHPGATKTDAELRTMSLLLDDTARINSKPELEIYTDDVKCAHGATIGQLDDSALFYLRSRGIDPANARRLLMQAFIAQCIDEPLVADDARELFEEVWT